MGLHEVVDVYILSRKSCMMHQAKYFKVLDSVESDPVQPVDVLSEEGSFRRRCLSRRTLLCVAVLIVLILAIVFIALYAHQISKKCETSTTEPTTTVCISPYCVHSAAGQFILKLLKFYLI